MHAIIHNFISLRVNQYSIEVVPHWYNVLQYYSVQLILIENLLYIQLSNHTLNQHMHNTQ